MVINTMNSDSSQTLAKKWEIGIEMLEPAYINKCSNLKELEKILRVLRSGEEGTYKHVEIVCEEKIRSIDPKNRLLRKEERLRTVKDLPADDKTAIYEDMKNWTTEMKNRDGLVAVNPGSGDASNLESVPIRKVKKLAGAAVAEEPIKKSTKNPAPRSYAQWDKYINQMDSEDEREPEKPNADSGAVSRTRKPHSLSSSIDCSKMSEGEKEMVANKEKDKGNEAFRSNDLAEAVAYYNRSLSVMPFPATYNNRALAFIKMKKWSDAVSDCEHVLRAESWNLKARLRRAAAYLELRKFRQAQQDLDLVLQKEPHNPRAKEIMEKVTKELKQENQRKAQGKGKIMAIEETDGESSDEEVEHIDLTNEHHSQSKPAVTTADHAQYVTDVKPTQPKEQMQSQSRRIAIDESDSEGEADSVITKSESVSTHKEVESSPVQKVDLTTDQGTLLSGQESRSSLANGTHKKPASRCNSLYSIIQKDIANQSKEDPTRASDAQSADSGTPNIQSKQSPTHAKTSEPEENPTESITNQINNVQTNQTLNPKQPTATQSELPTTSNVGFSLSSEPTSQSTAEPVTTTTPVDEPFIIKVPNLPVHVDELKQDGNKLFKAGQYGEAVSYYTRAIKHLAQDDSMTYHQGQLLSNRAACHLKSGACKAAVEDCTKSLELTPHNTKSLLRRATAYEAIEKYKEAYADYKHVTIIEYSQNALAGANRCQKILSEEIGPKWRAHLPKVPSASNLPQYEIGGSLTSPNQSQSTNKPSQPTVDRREPTAQLKQELPSVATPSAPIQPQGEPVPPSPTEPRVSKTEQPPVRELTNEEQFNQLKEEGNKLVAKGEFDSAIVKYTLAMEIMPDNVTLYSNRALCYIRINKPNLTIRDCDTVLARESTHIKALFRRAQAYKMVKRYKESLSDLMSLLKLDPKNVSAKKEADIVKGYYRTELQTKKAAPESKPTPTPEPQSKKKSTRVLIEEASDEESKSKPAADNSKSKSRQKKTKKVKQATVSINSPGVPIQTKAPSLSENATPYEFTTAWNSLKGTTDKENYYRVLRQIPPSKIAQVLSNKLEAEMLEIIVECLDEYSPPNELGIVEEYLRNIATVPRFSMILMFISSSCKRTLENIFAKLKKSSKQIDKLRIAYNGISSK